MPLEKLCAERSGEFNSRLRTEGIDFLEVCSRNAEGETLILIDGMVFDVTRCAISEICSLHLLLWRSGGCQSTRAAVQSFRSRP